MKRWFIAGAIVCMVLSIVVRLRGLTAPVADWHSWRQVDTAAVARNFVRHNTIDLLHPRYDDLSNIQSGKDNPEGWRMVEMPIYQAAGALVYWTIPNITIEVALRLVSILSVAASVGMLGILLYSSGGIRPGIIGMLLYAVLPFSIYYGRTILPDSFAVFCALLSLLLLTKGHAQKNRLVWIIIAGIAASVSVLVRPMAIFLLLPSLYLLVKGQSVTSAAISLVSYGAILTGPLFFWRRWILQFPEGIAVSDWLYNKGSIRFKGAWFYWIFARRLAELILGYWGILLFSVGVITAKEKDDRIFSLLWLIGALLYVVIFAGGNVQHDYYQALIIPVIVWFSTKGVCFLINSVKGIELWSSRILAVVSLIFMFAFSWYTLRTYFWINHPEIVEAGKAADALLPKNAKVIASYNGDTTFLYQINRPGWPLGFDIDKKIEMGATHYVTISPTDSDLETKELARKYTVLVRNDRYAIIDLTHLK